MTKPIQTKDLAQPNPDYPTPGEAEVELAVLAIEAKGLSHVIAHYQKEINRVEKRLLAIAKKRWSLQVHLTVGIVKLPSVRTKSESKPKPKQSIEELIRGLSDEELEKLGG